MTCFFPVHLIARAAGLSAKTIHRRALREFWPGRVLGNRHHFQPPDELLAACQQLANGPGASFLDFQVADRDRAEFGRITARFNALCEAAGLIASGLGIERALRVTAIKFGTSASQLRVWAGEFARAGIAGLLEHKRGRVGRKAKGPSHG